MADQIVSLGCDNADEIAFEESILEYLRDVWSEQEYDFLAALEAEFYNRDQAMSEGEDMEELALSEDVDDLMPSEDEEWLLAGARKSEQQGGNPLFSVLRQRIHRPRRWQGGAVRQEHFRLELQQNRTPSDDKLGEAIAEAFHQNVRDYVSKEKLNPAHFRMQLKIHHNGDGVHVWTSSPVLPLEDWVHNKERTRQYIQQLSNELNSSQNINPTHDDFFAEFTLIYKPPAGGKTKKYNIKSLSYQQMMAKKRCIIQIHNTDELCCARAIVTLIARVQQHPQYSGIRQGSRLQTTMAYQLHRDAGVPEGPCGMAELEAFQTFLAPDYQLVVLEGLKGHIIFKNSLFDDAPHIISLLKTQDHYHAITSIPAFLNRAYFCRYCDKGYSTEDAEHHNCKGQNCPACLRKKNTCRNFAMFVTPTHHCQHCHRKFYGPDCLEAHRQGEKSICSRFVKCQECCKVYVKKKGHACYMTRCQNCGQGKPVNHRCYIQPIGKLLP